MHETETWRGRPLGAGNGHRRSLAGARDGARHATTVVLPVLGSRNTTSSVSNCGLRAHSPHEFIA